MADEKTIAAMLLAGDMGIKDPQMDFSSLLSMLAARINLMISDDFVGLVQILYRMDIDESKLKTILASNPVEDAGIIIANMMIERHEQKIRSRMENERTNDIPDDEKW